MATGNKVRPPHIFSNDMLAIYLIIHQFHPTAFSQWHMKGIILGKDSASVSQGQPAVPINQEMLLIHIKDRFPTTLDQIKRTRVDLFTTNDFVIK